jgi:ATP-dependent RNA helicase RhlE
MSFESLGLCEPLLRALRHEGYERPTPIQLQAIPLVLKGADVLACAQTGTGKTAGFALPLLQQLTQKTPVKRKQVRILILTPTRELADQVHESVATYGKYLKMRSAVVFGGVKSVPQVVQLRGGVEILVATPGRLLDLHQQHAFSFESLETLVLDEADRMLDMGFLPDIQRILKLLPSLRQNLLFSATLSPEIRQLAKAFLKNPVEISVTPRQIEAETVQQKVYVIDKSRKAELLAYLIQRENWSQVLVFSRTKYGADKLVKHLKSTKNLCNSYP